MFASIEQWETEHVSKMESGKEAYIQNLEDKRVNLVQRFEMTPQSIANKHKRWRIAADIEQLKWRVNYLNNLSEKIE